MPEPCASLANHVPELRQLGRLYRDHALEGKLRKIPGRFPIAVHGTRMILESDRPLANLGATAFHRFQTEGADILAPRYQYALTLAGEGTTLDDAYQDMLALSPPRTRQAVEEFLPARGSQHA